MIDLFVQPAAEHGMGSLLPYMPDSWQTRFTGLGLQAGKAFAGASPSDVLDRLDDGPASSALLVPVDAVNAWPDADLTTTVLAAANAYFAREWLPLDERLRLAVLVCGQDPRWSADEIRRGAAIERVAAAALAPMHVLLGDRSYHPIYEACGDAGLPLIVYMTGAEGLYIGAPQAAAGATLNAVERRVALAQITQAQINSLVFDGVFERFPRLRVVFAGVGFGWLVPLLWRMDMDWRRTRVETPWVKRLPSAYVRDHVRLAPGRSDGPRDGEQLAQALEMAMAEHVLVYGSGFPRAGHEEATAFVASLPDALRERVTSEAAEELLSGAFAMAND